MTFYNQISTTYWNTRASAARRKLRRDIIILAGASIVYCAFVWGVFSPL